MTQQHSQNTRNSYQCTGRVNVNVQCQIQLLTSHQNLSSTFGGLLFGKVTGQLRTFLIWISSTPETSRVHSSCLNINDFCLYEGSLIWDVTFIAQLTMGYPTGFQSLLKNCEYTKNTFCSLTI